MSLYHLQESQNEITFQPFNSGQKKSIYILIASIALGILPFIFKWKEDVNIFMWGLAIIAGGWSAYDAFIRSKTIIVFDKQKKAVYKTIPGILKKQLIMFNKIESIVPIYTNEVPQYCITHNENMFGKNYPISKFFYGTSPEKTEFENEILPAINAVIRI